MSCHQVIRHVVVGQYVCQVFCQVICQVICQVFCQYCTLLFDVVMWYCEIVETRGGGGLFMVLKACFSRSLCGPVRSWKPRGQVVGRWWSVSSVAKSRVFWATSFNCKLFFSIYTHYTHPSFKRAVTVPFKGDGTRHGTRHAALFLHRSILLRHD